MSADEPSDELVPRLNMAEAMREFEQAERDLEARKAKRDPKAKKRVTLVAGGSMADYSQHYAGNTRSGSRVMFCVSDRPNVIGQFLVWRETWPNGRRFIRTKWQAFESHQEATGQAKRLAEQWRGKQKDTGP